MPADDASQRQRQWQYRCCKKCGIAEGSCNDAAQNAAEGLSHVAADVDGAAGGPATGFACAAESLGLERRLAQAIGYSFQDR